jgi:hypothetical protein
MDVVLLNEYSPGVAWAILRSVRPRELNRLSKVIEAFGISRAYTVERFQSAMARGKVSPSRMRSEFETRIFNRGDEWIALLYHTAAGELHIALKGKGLMAAELMSLLLSN